MIFSKTKVSAWSSLHYGDVFTVWSSGGKTAVNVNNWTLVHMFTCFSRSMHSSWLIDNYGTTSIPAFAKRGSLSTWFDYHRWKSRLQVQPYTPYSGSFLSGSLIPDMEWKIFSPILKMLFVKESLVKRWPRIKNFRYVITKVRNKNLFVTYSRLPFLKRSLPYVTNTFF